MPGSRIKDIMVDGKTLEQTFQGLTRGSAEYEEALNKLIQTATTLNDLDQDRQERLRAFLEGLGDVENSWDRINRYIEESLTFSNEYSFTLNDVRSSLGDIVSELASVRSTFNEQIQPVRKLRDLSGEISRALTVQGALHESNFNRITRNVSKEVELVEYQIRSIANIEASESLANPSAEVLNQMIQKGLEIENTIQTLQERLSSTPGLSFREKRDLEELIRLYRLQRELIDETNLSRIEGLKKTSDSIQAIAKDVRREFGTMGQVAKVAKGFGFDSFNEVFEQEVQDRVRRRVEVESAFQTQSKLLEQVGNIRATYSPEKVDTAQKLLETARDRRADLSVQSEDLSRQVQEAVDQKQVKRTELEQALSERNVIDPFVSEDQLQRAIDLEDKIVSLRSEYNSISLIADDLREKQSDLNNLLQQAVGEESSREKTYNNMVNSLTLASKIERDSQKNIQEATEREIRERKSLFTLMTGVTPEMLKALPGMQTMSSLFGATASAARTAAGFAKGLIPSSVLTSLGTLTRGFGPIGTVVSTMSKSLLGSLGPAGLLVTILRGVWKAFKEVSVEAAELKRRVGSWEIGTAAFNDRLITSVEWLKTATELADFTGLNSVTIFDKDQIAAAAEFKKLTGSSAEAANNLLIRSRLLGQSTDEFRENLTKGANEGNRLNASVFNLREIQTGVLKASDATALSYGNSAEALSRAVVAAKNLGMELSGIEKISDSLLNFESSIASEMEAQLLTGMSLNLQKAREYALNNNLEGVATEIQRQGVTAARFTNMNRIQQEGLAKALGMSRDELAKSLILRELNNGASAEALAIATQMKKEDIEALSMSERWNVISQKFLMSLTPILEVVIDILDPVAKIVSFISKGLGYLSGWLGYLLRLGGLMDKFAGLFGFSEKFNQGKEIKVSRNIAEESTIARKVTVANTNNGTTGEAYRVDQDKANRQVGTAALTWVSMVPLASVALRGLGKVMSSALASVRSTASLLTKAVTSVFVSPGQSLARAPIEAVTSAQTIGSKPVGGSFLPRLGRNIASFIRIVAASAGGAAKALLVLGGISLSVLALGYGLGQAAPFLEAAGSVLKNALEGLSTLIVSTANAMVVGFKGLMEGLKELSWERIGYLAVLGPTLLGFTTTASMAVPGLIAFGAIGVPMLNRIFNTLGKAEGAGRGIRGIVSGLSELIGLVGPLDTFTDSLTRFGDKVETFKASGIEITNQLGTETQGTLKQTVETERNLVETGKITRSVQGKVEVNKGVTDQGEKNVQHLEELKDIRKLLNDVVGLLKEGQTIDFNMGKFYEAQNRVQTIFG